MTAATLDEVKVGAHYLRIGNPCTVKLRGAARSKPGVYFVTEIVQLDDGTMKVGARNPDHAAGRLYFLDEITYVMPGCKTGKDAAFHRDTVRLVTAPLGNPRRRRVR